MRPKSPNSLQKFWRRFRAELKWLSPGMGVKRWMFFILAGTTLLGIGFGVLVLDVYRTAPDTWWLPVLSAVSLRFLDRTLRAIIFGGFGVGLMVVGIMGLYRSLLMPFISNSRPVVDTVSAYRRRERGPDGGHRWGSRSFGPAKRHQDVYL